jgi:hypothetical protein
MITDVFEKHVHILLHRHGPPLTGTGRQISQQYFDVWAPVSVGLCEHATITVTLGLDEEVMK